MPKHTGRRMPIKTVEIDLTEDGYPGFTAKARTNVPIRIADEFTSGDESRGRKAALIIFPEWDFVDEEGEPIAHTVEGFAQLPQDLFEAMVLKWKVAVKAKAAIPKASDDGSVATSQPEPEEPAEGDSPSPTPASASPASSDAGPGSY